MQGIRRIYFSDRLYSEEELPPEFKLFLPVAELQTKVEALTWQAALPVAESAFETASAVETFHSSASRRWHRRRRPKRKRHKRRQLQPDASKIDPKDPVASGLARSHEQSVFHRV